MSRVSEFLMKPRSRSFNEVSVLKVTVSTTSLLFGVAQCKKKTQLKVIYQMFHFAYVIQQNFTIWNVVKTLEITPTYNNFFMVWHEFFLYTSMQNYTIWQHCSMTPVR